MPLFAYPAQGGGCFVEALVELLDARGRALAVTAAVGGDASGLLGAVGRLFTAFCHALRGCGQLRCGGSDLADLHLLGFDFSQGAAGMGVEGAHGIAYLRCLMVDSQQAVTQLHHGDVEGGADRRQFIASLHRHLQAEVTVTQGFGQQGDAAGAEADGRLQADKKVKGRQQQAAQHRRHQCELADRRSVIMVQPCIQGHQGLLAQSGQIGQQGVQVFLEVFRFQADGAAEHAVVEHFQFGIQALEAALILTGPGLQVARQACFQEPTGLEQLIPGVADAAAQVPQLQAALQCELARHYRGLSDAGQASDPLDQLGGLLGRDLGQQIGFEPGGEGQAIVHHDLLTQGLQCTEGGGEAIIAVRPPTYGAQAFRVQTFEAVLQGLVAGEDVGFGAFGLQSGAQVIGGLVEGRLYGIESRHRGKRGRRRLPIGFRGAPTGSAVALGGEQVVQVVQGQ